MLKRLNSFLAEEALPPAGMWIGPLLLIATFLFVLLTAKSGPLSKKEISEITGCYQRGEDRILISDKQFSIVANGQIFTSTAIFPRERWPTVQIPFEISFDQSQNEMLVVASKSGWFLFVKGRSPDKYIEIRNSDLVGKNADQEARFIETNCKPDPIEPIHPTPNRSQ